MDTGWEVYSKMVLKQLEDLGNSMNGLRIEIQELKSEIAELRGKQSNIQDLKEWKGKIDEVCSPSQLKDLKEEVDELKLFKTLRKTIQELLSVMIIDLIAKKLKKLFLMV